MRDVILHVGHGKTGTSAIQCWLAQNKRAVAAAGMVYPDHPSLSRAERCGVTSGNICGDVGALLGQLEEEDLKWPADRAILFSNELLFWKLEEIIEASVDLRSRYNFKVVLFIRNPLEMANSAYHQRVKRGGETGSFEDYLQQEGHLLHAEKCHRLLLKNNIETRLINYSARSADVVGAFIDALDLDKDGSLGSVEKSMPIRVNRSLSLTELELVKQLNKLSGRKSGSDFSDWLVELAPDIESYRFTAEGELLNRFRERFSASVGYFNLFLPETEQLDHGSAPCIRRNDLHEIDQRQMEAIAAAVGAILRDRDSLAAERDAIHRELKRIVRHPWKNFGQFFKGRLQRRPYVIGGQIAPVGE
ncbi:hypothetical protein [Aliiruegeria sabulilitoris]|uniref:hypothetical protein n=1 Tax=Aliiruegeria sabulilitoris TaxID=1510458 RepID=UPI00082D5C5D|nr:hypothetical protein [Aliiruegeria sabulilitoris]NDR57242.1 hypothetical protein [Pseudoruegeria sp. M32A2M]